jgi:phage tail sheath protein FI
MPAHVTYPGVYIVEKSSGAQAIAAASTSTALFVGMADKGPFGSPTRVLSQAEYDRTFGATSKGEMADQVHQFYVNGGTEAWIMRIANAPVAAAIQIQRETGGTTALTLTARDPGAAGNMIRAEVDYGTSSPERLFNLTFYRHVLNADGTWSKTESESFKDLSMDSGSPRYVVNLLKDASALVTVTDPTPTAAAGGRSISGTIWATATATARILANITASENSLNISVNHKPPVKVVLPTGAVAFGPVTTAINNALANALLTETVALNLRALTTGNSVLEISSANGPVVITPAATNDVTTRLMLGVAAGGVEIDDVSSRRPAQSGLASLPGTLTGTANLALTRIEAFADLLRNAPVNLVLTDPEDPTSPWTKVPPYLTGVATDRIYANAGAVPANAPVGSLANVRQAMDDLVTALGALNVNLWSARRTGLTIELTPKLGGPNYGAAATVTTTGTDIGSGATGIFGTSTGNAAAYSLGATTIVGKQASAVPGFDGNVPVLGDYQIAFGVLDSELDSFNIMVLPRADTQTDPARHGLWGIASALAAKKRAILLVDPDSTWASIANAESGVATLKVGVETRNAAVFWPRLLIPDAAMPAGRPVDPSGSIAGLMARTDARFGVWHAAAGIEATIRGIVGIGKNMSDDENGVLNPKALNAIRLFPSGAVAWGARTMIGSDDTGNIDDKYIPVRRTMLFIEESLYVGLKWAVFEPNAEPLWSRIRLAAGSFMNGLMRQGAFASMNKLEAYYVLCDATTTTETDINLGIVNVVVAFAPLKPAEFVVVTVTQIAGQVQV